MELRIALMLNAGEQRRRKIAIPPSDRAPEFKPRCDGLKIKGVSLHPDRSVWAERALKCSFPERFAQQALGHNSKAVPHACSRHAEVTAPSLADWEKGWNQKLKAENEMPKPKVVLMDFRASPAARPDGGAETALQAIAQAN